jgi:tetratricopeptide (TPR) repeat protein
MNSLTNLTLKLADYRDRCRASYVNLPPPPNDLIWQILMELGRYQEALKIFREILPMKPCDSVALTSLGLCLSALGYQPPQPHTATPTNYALKIKLMDDPNEFVNSVDPEELLEAGSTFNLSNIFYQVRMASEGDFGGQPNPLPLSL